MSEVPLYRSPSRPIDPEAGVSEAGGVGGDPGREGVRTLPVRFHLPRESCLVT
jgi:hypothetical protein